MTFRANELEPVTPKHTVDGGVCHHPKQNDPRHYCRCHALMGNDFWFLPADACLFAKDAP